VDVEKSAGRLKNKIGCLLLFYLAKQANRNYRLQTVLSAYMPHTGGIPE
jgi:hypothetical protein